MYSWRRYSRVEVLLQWPVKSPAVLPCPAGTDVPAVIAPPGRTRATARMRQQGNSLSRPSSVHVDDFQRGVGPKQESRTPGSGGPGRASGPGSHGQRSGPHHGSSPGGPGQRGGTRHGSSPGGPSLQKLLSDPAVVAVSRLPPLLQPLLTHHVSHCSTESTKAELFLAVHN